MSNQRRNQRLKSLLKSRTARRVYRGLALALGAGIAFLGAGNIYGLPAIESALFGATGAVLGLIMALSFIFAAKDEIPDRDFDEAINSAIESVNSKAKKKQD